MIGSLPNAYYDRQPERSQRIHWSFGTRLATFGRFRCAPDDPAWREVNRTGALPLMAFPSVPVWIQPDGRRRLCADPSGVMTYNPSSAFRREMLTPSGDACDVLVLAPSLMAELLGRRHDEPRFVSSRSRASAGVPVLLAATRRAGETGDALLFEELAISLASRVLHGATREPDAFESETEQRRVGVAEDCLAVLASRFAEPLSLEDVAHAVGVSPSHLSRIVRAHTGRSIHAHRVALRLDAALRELLDTDRPVAEIALATGFFDQPHMTRAFRRRFGVTPAHARRRGAIDLSRNLQDSAGLAGRA